MKRPAVGDDLPVLTKPAIDRVQLVKYASASRDFNPIHFDHLYAVEGGHSQVIAHGMLSAAFLGQLCTRWAGAGRVRSLEVRFRAITYPGDEITCRGKVISVDGALARVELEAAKADGTLVTSGTAEVWVGDD